MAFVIRFYRDIVRYHETDPCQLHNRTYATMEEAEKVAQVELTKVRAKHGGDVGYAVFDGELRAVAIGPGRGDDDAPNCR